MDAPDMLALCDEHDLASINRIPLAMGMLSGQWTAGTQPPGDHSRSAFLEVPAFVQGLGKGAGHAPGRVLPYQQGSLSSCCS